MKRVHFRVIVKSLPWRRAFLKICLIIPMMYLRKQATPPFSLAFFSSHGISFINCLNHKLAISFARIGRWWWRRVARRPWQWGPWAWWSTRGASMQFLGLGSPCFLAVTWRGKVAHIIASDESVGVNLTRAACRVLSLLHTLVEGGVL